MFTFEGSVTPEKMSFQRIDLIFERFRTRRDCCPNMSFQLLLSAENDQIENSVLVFFLQQNLKSSLFVLHGHSEQRAYKL